MALNYLFLGTFAILERISNLRSIAFAILCVLLNFFIAHSLNTISFLFVNYIIFIEVFKLQIVKY